MRLPELLNKTTEEKLEIARKTQAYYIKAERALSGAMSRKAGDAHSTYFIYSKLCVTRDKIKGFDQVISLYEKMSGGEL